MRFQTWKWIAAGSVVVLSACTSVQVQKLDTTQHAVQEVCIVRNPKVAVSDMLSVLEGGFMRHGITTRVIGNPEAFKDSCPYTLEYTAKRSWDLAPYLTFAELKLRKDGQAIAMATYRHSGGFALNKWASTETKLGPVIDDLLKDVNPR